MERIVSPDLLILLFLAGAGVIALVVVMLVLRWVLGVKEIFDTLHAIQDELKIIREQQVAASRSATGKPDAVKSDVPHAEPSPLDMPIPEDWRLGRHDKK